MVSVRDDVHPPNAIQISYAWCRTIHVERGVIAHRHLGKVVKARHGKSESPRPVRILTQIDSADQQVLADDLKNVVEALPGRIEVVEQDIAAGLERAGVVMLHFNFLEAVTGMNAIVSITGDPCVLIALILKCLLKAGKDRRGHGVEHIALRKEALPILVVADLLLTRINCRTATL